MMLNDVVEQQWDISDMDKIPEQDSYNHVRITMTIPFHLAKKLSVSYASNNKIMEVMIGEYVERSELQHHAASLLFDGREPRHDVLNNLLEIAKTLESDSQFPNFFSKHLEYKIKYSLDNPDPRTLRKYVNCVKRYVIVSSGVRVTALQPYNLFHFKDAVLSKLQNLESTSICKKDSVT